MHMLRRPVDDASDAPMAEWGLLLHLLLHFPLLCGQRFSAPLPLLTSFHHTTPHRTTPHHTTPRIAAPVLLCVRTASSDHTLPSCISDERSSPSHSSQSPTQPSHRTALCLSIPPSSALLLLHQSQPSRSRRPSSAQLQLRTSHTFRLTPSQLPHSIHRSHPAFASTALLCSDVISVTVTASHPSAAVVHAV